MTRPSINDLIKTKLTEQGYVSGSLNDRLYQLFINELGESFGSLSYNDAEKKWLESRLSITSPSTRAIPDLWKREYAKEGYDNQYDYWFNFTLSYDPAALFEGATIDGGWYDASDMDTLFQDAAGTTPVVADGDPVGRINDKSGNGNHLTQTTSSDRPIWRTDGTYSWLEFDGITDHLTIATGICTTPSNNALSIHSTASLDNVDGFSAGFRTICAQGAAFEDTGAWSFVWSSYNAEMEVLVSDNDLRLRAPLADTTLDRDYIFSSIATPTLTETWQDGVLLGALGASPFDYQANDFSIGYDLRPDRYWRGKIYQVLVIEKDTSDDREDLESYFAGKAGVTL